MPRNVPSGLIYRCTCGQEWTWKTRADLGYARRGPHWCRTDTLYLAAIAAVGATAGLAVWYLATAR
jgi:hypothetical protein